jgi:hypothetical protein
MPRAIVSWFPHNPVRPDSVHTIRTPYDNYFLDLLARHCEDRALHRSLVQLAAIIQIP